MNPNEIISISVSLITAIITITYLWKTRVIGADKELLNKYKDGYKEYKDKFDAERKAHTQLGIQYDMLNTRYSELKGRLLAMENQPLWPNNHSLEVLYDPDKPVSQQY
jgi:hypothetical protein